MSLLLLDAILKNLRELLENPMVRCSSQMSKYF